MDTGVKHERRNVQMVYTRLEYNPLSALWGFGCGGFILALGISFVLDRVLTFFQVTPPISESTMLIIIILILFCWLNIRTRIVIRDDGLELHRFGIYHTFSTWKNLNRIGIREIHGSDSTGDTVVYQRVLFRNDGQPLDIGEIINISMRKYATDKGFFKNYTCMIDVDELVESSFGQHLLKYAPHVIEKAIKEQEALAKAPGVEWY